MTHWIGAGLMIAGGAGMALAWIVNTNLPIQLGPVPFFGSCALAFAGLLIWSF